jgi:hypothetical protein
MDCPLDIYSAEYARNKPWVHGAFHRFWFPEGQQRPETIKVKTKKRSF